MRSAVCSIVLLSVMASSLRETAQTFISTRHRLAFVNQYNRVSTKAVRQSPMSLNYRVSNDDLTQEMYTDRLWQSALVADSVRVELQPVHDELASKSKDSSDGLIETAKAFIPVAIEIGAVAALAATVTPN